MRLKLIRIIIKSRYHQIFSTKIFSGVERFDCTQAAARYPRRFGFSRINTVRRCDQLIDALQMLKVGDPDCKSGSAAVFESSGKVVTSVMTAIKNAGKNTIKSGVKGVTGMFKKKDKRAEVVTLLSPE